MSNEDASVTSAIDTVRSDVPKHIAIIMDGNGRWAKARGLPRASGHELPARANRTPMILR